MDTKKRIIDLTLGELMDAIDERIEVAAQKHKMNYNEFGNINKAKKIYFYYRQKTYAFVFQIGSGSYYVQQ